MQVRGQNEKEQKKNSCFAVDCKQSTEELWRQTFSVPYSGDNRSRQFEILSDSRQQNLDWHQSL